MTPTVRPLRPADTSAVAGVLAAAAPYQVIGGDRYRSGMTGTRRSHRGRGLAGLVKWRYHRDLDR